MGLDLWLLLLLASLAGKRCEAVHKLLKKKFAEGLADTAWLDRAVCGHQVSQCLTCFTKSRCVYDVADYDMKERSAADSSIQALGICLLWTSSVLLCVAFCLLAPLADSSVPRTLYV